MDKARTISPTDWSAQKAALYQEVPAPRGTLLDRLLGPMNQHVARSFTEAQLQELERVLEAASSRPVPIDIRVTIPFFWRRYFITFLAGSERRSAARLKKDRARHALWTVAIVCCFVFLLLLIVPALIGLVHIITFAG